MTDILAQRDVSGKQERPQGFRDSKTGRPVEQPVL